MSPQLDTRLASHSPTALGAFRAVVGLLFTGHGTSLLFGWPSGPAAEFGVWPDFFAGVIEFLTGALVTTGLFTRVAAFLASGTMAFAYFTVHLPDGWIPLTNNGELSVLYCFAFFLLVFTGGGAFALDTARRRR
ncbi:phosphoribosylaminoimidazolecarboxamide formyltransferase [Mycolicibacterium litorale]|nr:phosphoribosylaminoimidazolecarboxamide formyltransferase [Mycolicibacterium litorale]